MGLFGKKKEEAEPGGEEEKAEEEKPAEEPAPDSGGGDVSLGKISADLEKLKAQFSTFYEVNKAATERFTRINEQIGELRSMLIQRDKDSQLLEAKATQAIDMVKTVQPDKLMVELRKEDSKIEALKANIESNESILNNASTELREMRNRMSTFKGMEQVVKLNEEVKAELMDIKKTSALIGRHSDKVETIFSEMQKRSREFERITSTVDDLDKTSKQMTSDVDSIKVKASDLASKKEVENVVSKVEAFEKHTSNVLNLINNQFNKLKEDFEKKFEENTDKVTKLLNGFEILAQKTPDLNKYFDLLEKEALKAPKKDEKVEKIKEPGQEEEAPKEEGKAGILSKIKEKVGKK